MLHSLNIATQIFMHMQEHFYYSTSLALHVAR